MNYNDVALRMIENEIGRPLALATRTERYAAREVISLKAWPVESVSVIEPVGRWIETPDAEALEQEAVIRSETGEIAFAGLSGNMYLQRQADWQAQNTLDADGPELLITYTAGYSVLPDAITAAVELLAAALKSAAENGGQQVTYQALDGYQVTYASRYTEGQDISMMSPAAAILIAPYKSVKAG